MDYKLFFSDVDDTLIPMNSMEITPYAISTLNKLQKLGLEYVPCTGRSYSLLSFIVDSVHPKYAIVSNGAMVYDICANKFIHKSLIDKETAIRVFDFERQFNSYSIFFLNDGIYLDEYYRDFYFNKRPNAKKYIKESHVMKDPKNEIFDKGYDLSKIMIHTTVEDRDEIMNQAIKLFPNLFITSYDNKSIEMTNKDGHKGNAIKWLCNYLNIDTNNCIYAGDSDNDITAINSVGLTLAPSNASTKIKKLAKIVTDDVCNDGVIKELEKMFIQK